MNDIREIVTKAVVGKGKKLVRLTEALTPVNEVYSILGCWIINHAYDARLDENKVIVNGAYEINIWYSYDNNTKTDIAKLNSSYTTIIKTRQIVDDLNTDCREVIVRTLQQPTCTNATISESVINVDVVIELVAEIIGETKVKVAILNQIDPCDPYEVEDFENEINEDFLNEQVE